MLHRHNLDMNVHRFYSMFVMCDLFGEWQLLREWGRIGSSGQIRTDRFSSEAQARAAYDTLLRQKQRRGYELIARIPDCCVPIS
jgi:predicted DNA-binding WGR domain protein